jgi:hypothetical protein
MQRVRDLMPVFDQALYAGIRLQRSWVEDGYGLLEDEYYDGATIFVTRKGVLWPITLSVGSTDPGGFSVWVSLGRPVDDASVLSRATPR